MLSEAQRATLHRLAAADGASFAELVTLAGLDPAHAFRGADLRGVDFGAIDLSEYDFSGADLTGASLRHARIGDAIFTAAITKDVRWPARRRQSAPLRAPSPVLAEFQREAVDSMLADLTRKRRALALMPTGTGRSAVLEEVIAASLVKYRSGVLIVDTVAEREQFASRLRERLGSGLVWTAKDIRNTPPLHGLLVHVATFRDLTSSRLPEPIETFGLPDCIFTISVEKVNQLARRGGDMFGSAMIVTVDSSPLYAGRPDRHQFATRIKRLFGEPSFVMEIEQALTMGLLEEVRIIPHPDVMVDNAYLLRRSDGSPGDSLHIMEALAPQIVDLFEEMRACSLFVLCRNESHAAALAEHLHSDLSAPRAVMRLSRTGPILPPHELAEMRAIIIAAASRRTMQVTGQHPCVAVIAPLSVARAQDLAYRPPSTPEASASPPVIHDLVDAFAGFAGRDLDTPKFHAISKRR